MSCSTFDELQNWDIHCGLNRTKKRDNTVTKTEISPVNTTDVSMATKSLQLWLSGRITNQAQYKGLTEAQPAANKIVSTIYPRVTAWTWDSVTVCVHTKFRYYYPLVNYRHIVLRHYEVLRYHLQHMHKLSIACANVAEPRKDLYL